MKKLLMKLFPKYFTVINKIELDRVEVLGHPYKLTCVNVDESNNTLDILGLTEERGYYLYKKIIGLIESKEAKDKVDLLIKMEPEIRHINEFYACVLFMDKIIETIAEDPIIELMKILKNQSHKGEK